MKEKDHRRIAIINSVSNKSTGKISMGLYKYYKALGAEVYFCYGYGEKSKNRDLYKIDYNVERYTHAFLTRLTGYQGYFSTFATRRLLKFLSEHQINTIYGVGLHGYYLNEPMFFEYVSKNHIDFVYIMTEEYPFYGKCGYANKCTNYLKGCGKCPYLKEYPKSWFFDRTATMFNMKKKAYSEIKDHSVFVGPEYTINAGLKSPLLKDIKTQVIDEAVDTDFYYPRDTTEIEKEYGIDSKKIVILCVAPSSQGKKGTKYFLELARRFEENDNYVFVHVGYTDDLSVVPKNYVAIGYVYDQEKLAQLYSIGDLMVFPSLLDTMPNTCLESLSCGVPLLCFNTSGMPYLGGPDVLTLVEPKNVDQLYDVVIKTGKKTCEIINICRDYAIKRYSSKHYFEKLQKVLEQI